MASKTNISYFTRQNIDTEKWDACIQEATNGLIYGYSFYLDQMAKHWDALVLNDYEAVMPLTWNKKCGIYYLYQPAFVACGGIFGKKISGDTVLQFLNAIPNKFRLIEMPLNRENKIEDRGNEIISRRNYVLSLNKPYNELRSNYRENIRRNVKRCREAGCIHKTNIPVEDIIAINKQFLQKVSRLSDLDYQHFSKLYYLLKDKEQAETYGIFNPGGQLLASAVFFFFHARAYYILVGNHPDGKTLGASHYLIDRFIADHCNQYLLLDFEGSDIRNLAFFYSSFGSDSETYPALRINRLPWWIKWLKK
jgi:hypothetical protein